MWRTLTLAGGSLSVSWRESYCQPRSLFQALEVGVCEQVHENSQVAVTVLTYEPRWCWVQRSCCQSITHKGWVWKGRSSPQDMVSFFIWLLVPMQKGEEISQSLTTPNSKTIHAVIPMYPPVHSATPGIQHIHSVLVCCVSTVHQVLFGFRNSV